MHPETHLALHEARAVELRSYAEAHRLATEAKPPRTELRTRVGWTLVEVGLRLAASPRPALA
ncbi:MAG: hypothetical protein HOV73_21250 [Streptomyces sp.]|nr:hypothetical protein [Streptomyces sp.]NUS26460.1 hypothetical protein [Streptomyces sp.]